MGLSTQKYQKRQITSRTQEFNKIMETLADFSKTVLLEWILFDLA